MRVLVANALYGGGGGVESYIDSVIRPLVAHGHDVALLHELTSEEAAPDTLKGEQVERWCVAEIGVEECLRLVQWWGPDIVYQHGLFSLTLERALLDRYPAVLFAHSYYGACATGTKRHAFPSIRACTRNFGPACLALHYPRRCGGLNPATAVREYTRQRERHGLLERYRFVLVASRHMHHEYERQLGSAEALRVVSLPPAGIAPTPDPPQPRPRTGQVILAARLTRIKGGHHLIEALHLLREGDRLDDALWLTVLGNGPEKESLRRQADALDVDAQFLGWVDTEQRNQILASADVVAVPSLWPEPFGLIGIEGGCLGVPAVGYDTGGISEWLKPGVSGELAQTHPPTVPDLAEALARCVGDPEHYDTLRRGAWEVARGFSLEAHLDALSAVFDQAVEEPDDE